MKCADPILCYLDSKGNRKFRNFSFVKHQIGGFPDHIIFDCGKCIFCRKKRARDLALRCVLHASVYSHNCFITLTYDEQKKTYHNKFQYTDIQKFKHRLRKFVWRKYNKRIEVFNVHEYGKNGKKHWHLIVFNHDFEDKEIYTIKKEKPLYTSKKLEKLWPFGFSTIADVNEASAMYQAQYTQKDMKNGNLLNEKKSHSKHSGIGRPYFMLHYKQLLTLGYVPMGGEKVPLPRYFQRLAHRHYCHYYEPSAFHNTSVRKKKYNPFIKEEPNKEIADLYKYFKTLKDEFIGEKKKKWQQTLDQYLTTKENPDFIKSAENYLYDLNNKQKQERF